MKCIKIVSKNVNCFHYHFNEVAFTFRKGICVVVIKNFSYDDLFVFCGLDEEDLKNYLLVAEYIKLTQK